MTARSLDGNFIGSPAVFFDFAALRAVSDRAELPTLVNGSYVGLDIAYSVWKKWPASDDFDILDVLILACCSRRRDCR